MSRPYIRVTKSGGDAIRELMVDQRKVADLSYDDTCTLIASVSEHLRKSPRQMLVAETEHGRLMLDFVDQVEFVMQATSSLRW